MKERPILFSAEMVRAILEGRKTQTRRVVKIPSEHIPSKHPEFIFQRYKCPYGKTGDRLWVRETFVIATQIDPPTGKQEIWYKATPPDFLPVDSYKWRPSIRIPRWASRINLEIINIHVEKLRNISGEGAVAEGCVKDLPDFELLHYGGYKKAKQEFIILWDLINKKRGYGWDKNPWVWVVEFKRLPN